MKIVWNPALEKLGADASAPLSLQRPAIVFSRVMKPGDEIIGAPSASATALALVHSPDYVENVLRGREKNGFGTTDMETLGHALASNGVMIKAAAVALAHPGHPIMAPVAGFHHAHYDHGYGFCTFNGILAAVLDQRVRGRARGRVVIIDGDGHHGDGTDNILEHFSNKAMFANIDNVTGMRAKTWRRMIGTALADGPIDLLIYQAGADAHEADPFGAGYLSTEEMQARDEWIFTFAAKNAVPVVWNLAGGYAGENTYRLHEQTARAARYGAYLTLQRELAALDATAAAELEARKEVSPRVGGAGGDVVDEGGSFQS